MWEVAQASVTTGGLVRKWIRPKRTVGSRAMNTGKVQCNNPSSKFDTHSFPAVDDCDLFTDRTICDQSETGCAYKNIRKPT